MSITNAFVSSRSGLAATAAWSDVTANNIANADRAGYARRGLSLTSGLGGSGVQVEGIRRDVDGALDRMHRTEMSRTATQDAIAGGLEVHTALLGAPGDPFSIPGRITALQTSLDQLSNDPAQPALQRASLDAAAAVTSGLNSADATLKEAAADTRAGVKTDVATLNRLLAKTAELGLALAVQEPGTRNSAMLEDSLASNLDQMSELIDLRIQREPNGGITVYTAGGTPLIEGDRVQTLAFPDGDGRLFAGDAEITPGVAGARGFEEGRLAGRISLLNDVLPRMQLQLDETARMLVVSFTAADPGLGPDEQGLFVDSGGLLNPTGLAERLAINADVRGPGGDSLWRMRDGVSAVAPGPESDSTHVERMIGAFDVVHAIPPQVGLGTQAKLTDFVPAAIADQQVTRTAALGRADALRAGAEGLETARLGFQGVNVDDELQQLAAIEQSYAANAVMMRTLGEMIDTLLAAV